MSVVYLGSERPFERMQPALMLYVKEDLLHGKEATNENIAVRFSVQCTFILTYFLAALYFSPLHVSYYFILDDLVVNLWLGGGCSLIIDCCILSF